MTLHPLPAAAAIAALFAVGIACAGEQSFVATATMPVPGATVDPDGLDPLESSDVAALDVVPGPVASGTTRREGL